MSQSATLPADDVVPDFRGPRWPHYVLAGMWTSAVLILVFVWGVWDCPYGESIPNLITYSLTALVTIVSVFWLANYAPLPRRTRRMAALGIVLAVLGYAATVRGVEWSGDMRLIVHHRWESTDAERLAAHRGQPPAAAASTGSAVEVSFRTEDMPTYRGADARGIVFGPPLSQDWEARPPRTVWRQPCGGGYSQLVVVPPYAVTTEQRGPNEAVVCYDAATGAERWVQEYPAEFTEAMGGPGPRATPTIADGAVYSLGAQGDLLKLTLGTGAVQWRRNILQDYHAPNTEWAMTSSPVLIDGLLIVNPGGPKGDGLVALNPADGRTVWEREGTKLHGQPEHDSNRCGYSTPFVVELLGVRQIIMFDGTGLRSYVPETGALLWEYRHRNGAGVNVAQPLVFDDGRIFISCSYDVGDALVQVRHAGDTWSVEPLWANQNLRCKFTSPVLHDGYIYGLDEGILVCIDPATGERKWKKGRYGHGQLLLTNGQLVVHSEDGWAVLIDPAPEGLREVTKFRTFDDPKNWNPPALVDGKLYLRNHREMACFDLCGEPR